ncbi:hypothetical protein KWAN_4 [Erwinia phage vB_EamM_Kwan]|uniref:Uncharacterized protein n=1 Tax=Erwinia phage vB_EamM_Kwan TaxID=1883374 RepID=A0A1B2IDK7_9CAUD|nr:hypothetical protein BIZ80_gp004 [Erwinia phage vB_EamM_Kwan]ANZ49366.1 hypothetical protein KWAN_4 [Erwinia phage vB_EamM_Kwan]
MSSALRNSYLTVRPMWADIPIATEREIAVIAKRRPQADP